MATAPSFAKSPQDTKSPQDWGFTLGGAPILDCRTLGRVPTLVRRWRDIPPAIDQTPLDHHYLSLHLGGAKRLYRAGEGAKLTRDVEQAAYSVVPAGAAFQWLTEGPVDFMHVYFTTAGVDHFVTENFDRDPRSVSLGDQLGGSDPVMAALAVSLGEALAGDEPMGRAYIDDHIHLLLFRLLRLHSNAQLSLAMSRHALAPYKLRRSIDFMLQHLADPIGLADIAAAAETSPFHFSRMFRLATGKAPYAYLIDRRIEEASRLLRQCDLSLAEIARRSGFASPSQFSRMFRRVSGISPSDYRRSA